MRVSQERALDFSIHSSLVYQRAHKDLRPGILKYHFQLILFLYLTELQHQMREGSVPTADINNTN